MTGQVSEFSDKSEWKVKPESPELQLSVHEQPGRATLYLLRVYFSE